MIQIFDEILIDEIIQREYPEEIQLGYELFCNAVVNFFTKNSKLRDTIYTVRYRIKSLESIKGKLIRKFDSILNGDPLNQVITDFVGVRVLVLFSHQLKTIHESIMNNINIDGFQLFEDPKAYTWDPEMRKFLSELGLKCEGKESLYTSLHYVVKPNKESKITCEIQVRTLYEEVWGEIDHLINYPIASNNSHCVEQLKVLARLTTTGTKLLDSIWSSYNPKET